jgi:hypothetical protein
VRRIATVVRSLPAERFTTLEGGPSHIVARMLSRGERTYLYVVNDAPWPTTVTLDVAGEGEVAWQAFDGESGRSRLVVADDRRTWQATLEPYDIVGGAFASADVSLRNVQATVADGVAERLAAEVRQLWARSGGLQRTPPAIPVANGDFEGAPTAAEPIPGWTASDRKVVTPKVDQAHAGRRCVELGGVGDQGPVRLVSGPLPTLRCGRASLSIWLKAAGTEPAAVRLSLEGSLDGRPYRRTATIGGDAGGPPPDGQWRQFVFPVQDVPTAGLSDVRIVIESADVGGVYVDDVRASELDFTPAERLELSKIISLADYRLQRSEFGACARVLEEYWPRFLSAYVPAGDGGEPGPPEVAARRGPRPAPPAAPPGLRERMKGWLPEFMR